MLQYYHLFTLLGLLCLLNHHALGLLACLQNQRNQHDANSHEKNVGGGDGELVARQYSLNDRVQVLEIWLQLSQVTFLRALGNERDPLDRSLQSRQTDGTQNGNERGKDSTREDVTDSGHVKQEIGMN